MAYLALLAAGLVASSAAGCRKSETRHEVTTTTTTSPSTAVAVDAARVPDAAAAPADPPAPARPAAVVTRAPTAAVLDADECAITTRFRPLKFGHAPRWLAAAGDERHLVVVADDGPGALLAYRAAPTGQVPGELVTATAEGADRMLAVEAVGDLTMILLDGRCGKDLCLHVVVLDADAALLGAGASLPLPGRLTSWATAADGATGVYLYGEHDGAAPTFQRIAVAPTGKVRAEVVRGVTADARSDPGEIAAVTADGDAWAIVRGHGGRGEVVLSTGATVDLGVPAATVTAGALAELAAGVVGIATTGDRPLVARYRLDGQPVAGPEGAPPLDRMWGQPAFTSGRELHVMRMRHPSRSTGRSTYVDTVAAHDGAEPFAFVHWTGRGFLVLYTSWFEGAWRMFAATLVCDV